VLNDRNYPRFSELLAAAGVAKPTHMGFSVKGEDEDFEYAGTPSGSSRSARTWRGRSSGG
jgi:predicted NAD/FAD-binding protein